MKILNLFAGIGGNRTLWGDEHEITAVEWDQKRAFNYLNKFPRDKVIVGDAYEYFETNFEKFDIVWASPPCQTHTGITRMNVGIRYNNKKVSCYIPDMRLYGLIFFLKHHFRGNWIVENVTTFYKPLIKPTCIRGRHYYWSNIAIPSRSKKSMKNEIGGLGDSLRHKIHGFRSGYTKKQEDRNKINDNEGLILLDYLIGKTQMKLF